MKKIGISKRMAKGIFAVLIIALATTLVSATLLSSFGTVETTIDVSQSVTIDGHDWDDPVTHAIGGYAGCCHCFEHTVANNGCEAVCLDFETDPVEGIDFVYYEKPVEPSCCDHILELLVVKVLDGMAEWDDFDAYVDGTLVYSYDAQGGDPEDWITHTIPLTGFEIPCCGTHTITIDCTSNPWTHFDPYGQLAVDYVALYCEGEVLCDSVDIGDPTSEAGHNPIGWGPIEPANTGGTYGGIGNCRCTWFYEDPQNDASWATIELTCEDCYDPQSECDCDHPGLDQFCLGPGESIVLCLCYDLDILLAPGTYNMISHLVPILG